MYRSTLVQFSLNLSMIDLFGFVYISIFFLWLEVFPSVIRDWICHRSFNYHALYRKRPIFCYGSPLHES
jgi:hypothetical protein